MGNETEFWTAEALKAYAEATKEETVCGKKVLLKKLPASSLEGFSEKDKDSSFKLVQKGLVKPELSLEQIKALPLDIVKAIGEAITAFSGVKTEEAEKN